MKLERDKVEKNINREIDSIRDPVLKIQFYTQIISINKLHKFQRAKVQKRYNEKHKVFYYSTLIKENKINLTKL